jgi:outer membrane lipoprotein-sorting protein
MLRSAAMTETRLWDRAASVAAVDGRRRPAVVALPPGMPTVAELFEFMRDAESRFATLRMRIDERRATAAGEQVTRVEILIRHPGDAKVLTSDPGRVIGGDYEIWISDGELVRTYASAHKLGTQRPMRNRPRGLDDRDFPGAARVYEPVTALPFETLAETFVHPAGYCQNVLATGRTFVTGTDVLHGREVILVECDHPRSTQLAGDRPDYRISLAVDRELGVIVRLIESIGGSVTRQADAVVIEPDTSLPPSAFEFVFPSGTTMLY